MSIKKKLRSALVGVGLVCGSVVMGADSASAVSGCTYWSSPQVCVWASTGTKSGGRQWVGEVRGSAVTSTLGVVEIWGDGFYKIATGTTSSTWQIGKWVASGTNICTRFTWTNQWNRGGLGPVSCITIRA
jgi:hypothetical protein